MSTFTALHNRLVSYLFYLTIPASILVYRNAYAGCDELLRQGVFNTWNESTGYYSSNKWHQAWCTGKVEEVSKGGQTSVGLSILVESIPVGLSFGDAQTFQRLYKENFCSNTNASDTDFSRNDLFHKLASPELIASYVECRKVEENGLKTDFKVGSDKRNFMISMHYTQPFQGKDRPKIKSIVFEPDIVKCKGSLRNATELTASRASMLCSRSADVPVSILIDTELGGFHRDIEAVNPPPTDEEKVMKALPKGTILPWYNSTRIPKGWRICDGGAGTPNLEDKFLYGTTRPEDIGQNIGSVSHTHMVKGEVSTAYLAGFSPDNALERNGNHRTNHTHNFEVKSFPGENIPPAVKLLFIMKL